jgi:hypothetical protein
MADDKVGEQSSLRIDVDQDHEVRDWSKKFGVTPEQLRAAVAAVGTHADDVQQYLNRLRSG